MAITVGTPTLNPQQGTGTYSFSHTVESQSNRVLIVHVSQRDALVLNDVLVSGVTYNGVAMTLVRQETNGADGAACIGCSVWILVAPATGSNTVAITSSGTPSQSRAVACAFWGVDQTTPQDATAVGTNANGANPALSITTATTNSLVLGALARIGATAPTYLSGQAVISNGSSATASLDLAQRTVAAAGSAAMDMTLASARYAYVVLALREQKFIAAGAGDAPAATGAGTSGHGVSAAGAGDFLFLGEGAGFTSNVFATGAGEFSFSGYRARADKARTRTPTAIGRGIIVLTASGEVANLAPAVGSGAGVILLTGRGRAYTFAVEE